ncbi:MAG: ATP phosphoribosyltransferase [bacterium]|nr:ATP phosphoribosyltransferase [Deltaproteobacteria bacterium]MCP4908668.1 ATP phosphoribosyltransferase [bacterium]
MIPDERLRIAIPSKGRLREAALSTLERAGLRFKVSGRRLFSVCSDTGMRIIFTNTADIPVLVAEGVVDLGITGSDQVLEKGVDVVEHRRLGFGHCRLSIAVHKDAPYRSSSDLAGKVIGAKFVNLARDYFEAKGVENVQLIEIQGAVEVMVLLGLVDGIVEIVETGNSLVENDLVELERVLEAEAVLIGSAQPRDAELSGQLLRRVDGVLAAARYTLLEYNCPVDRIEEATRIAPGFSSPTVGRLQDGAWLSVKVLVEKSKTQRVIDALEGIGCVAILETELRHARL